MLGKEHKIKRGEIFVFRSNLAGRHGKGAALEAKRKYGALYGVSGGFGDRATLKIPGMVVAVVNAQAKRLAMVDTRWIIFGLSGPMDSEMPVRLWPTALKENRDGYHKKGKLSLGDT